MTMENLQQALERQCRHTAEGWRELAIQLVQILAPEEPSRLDTVSAPSAAAERRTGTALPLDTGPQRAILSTSVEDGPMYNIQLTENTDTVDRMDRLTPEMTRESNQTPPLRLQSQAAALSRIIERDARRYDSVFVADG